MAVLLDDGPLWLTDGTDWLKVSPEDIKPEFTPEPNVSLYPTGGHGIDVGKQPWVVKAKNIRFKSHADYITFTSTIFTRSTGWQYTSMYLQIKRDAAQSLNWPFDGVHETYKVIVAGFVPSKPGRGDDDSYAIEMMVFKVISAS